MRLCSHPRLSPTREVTLQEALLGGGSQTAGSPAVTQVLDATTLSGGRTDRRKFTLAAARRRSLRSGRLQQGGRLRTWPSAVGARATGRGHFRAAAGTKLLAEDGEVAVLDNFLQVQLLHLPARV